MWLRCWCFAEKMVSRINVLHRSSCMQHQWNHVRYLWSYTTYWNSRIKSRCFQNYRHRKIPPLVRAKLIPTLDRYDRDEPCSAVVLDDAPTHMDPTIGQEIRSAGALPVVIYTALFSPDLNAIENMFAIYKAYTQMKWHQITGTTLICKWKREIYIGRSTDHQDIKM